MLTITIFTLMTRSRWRDPSCFKDEQARRAYIAICRIMEAITMATILMGFIALFMGVSLGMQKLTFNLQAEDYKEAKIAVAELYGWEPQQVRFYRETVATPSGDYTNVYMVEKKSVFKSEKPRVFYSSRSYISSDGVTHTSERLSPSEEKTLGFSTETLGKIIDRKINNDEH